MTETIDPGKWDGIPTERFELGELVDFPVFRGGASVEAAAEGVFLPEAEVASAKSDKVSQRERLEEIFKKYGFIPTNSDELSTAWSIHRLGQRKNPAAKFLNNVLVHQQTKTKSKNPENALYEKVEQVEGYIRGSRIAKATLKDIQQQIEGRGEDQIAEFIGMSVTDSATLASMRAMVRKRKVENMLNSGMDKWIDLTNIKPDEIRQNLGQLSFNELAGQVSLLEGEMISRQEFWSKHFVGFGAHRAVTRRIEESINRLGLSEYKNKLS